MPAARGLRLALWTMAATMSSSAQAPSVNFATYSAGTNVGTLTAAPDGAVWFVETGVSKIGRITPAGAITEYATPHPLSGLTLGPDGALWFTEVSVSTVGRLTTSGAITEYNVPCTVSPSGQSVCGVPEAITAGPDGALWFTECCDNGVVGRITINGVVTQYFVNLVEAYSITPGPDGAVWFLGWVNGGVTIKAGRITASGQSTTYTVEPAGDLCFPAPIISGPDGNLWYGDPCYNLSVGEITTAGVLAQQYFPLSGNPRNGPAALAVGPDGAVWFPETNIYSGTPTHILGRVVPGGAVTEYNVPVANISGSSITTGRDGALWFTDGANTIIRAVIAFGLPSGPPTVFIDSPQNGSAVSGMVTVTGWAIDNSSSVGTAITSVQVRVDGALAGNATYGISRPDVCNVFPGRPRCPNVGFSFNTNALSPGSHTITVSAVDSDPAPDTGTASVTVTVSASTTPTVWIDSPGNGATISGTITLSGWAIDNISSTGTAVTNVQVKVDGTFAGTAIYGVSRPDVCNAFPGRPGCPNVGYSYQLDTSLLSPGLHTVAVSATDSDITPQTGTATLAITVANSGATTPIVFVDFPPTGGTVSGTISVSGWAIDNQYQIGTAITTVQVLVDGVNFGTATYGLSRPDVCTVFPGRPGCPNVGYSFALNTTELFPGSHTITVSATDSDTTPQKASDSVTITVSN
jgi:streptogramin lyase